MSQLPPFDPPYQLISAEFAKQMEHFSSGARVDSTDAVPKAAGDKFFFLTVPFAEKDEAKALGARWNAAAKKWYVPADKDRELFKRWFTK